MINIDVSHNLLLEELVCFDNDNLSLDVSANKNLEFLSCGGLLKEIDLTNNTELKELVCRCKLTKLDLSKNKKLKNYGLMEIIYQLKNLTLFSKLFLQ